jgi:hypothetical protein
VENLHLHSVKITMVHMSTRVRVSACVCVGVTQGDGGLPDVALVREFGLRECECECVRVGVTHGDDGLPSGALVYVCAYV